VGVEQILLETVRALPPEKQQELLDFAEFLAHRSSVKQPRHSIKGLCADLNIDIRSETIDEARREMWGGFPREDI
jgi:Protein of unknown function (DUF2281)